MVKNLIIVLFCAGCIGCSSSKKTTWEPEVKNIWDSAKHSAFTSLIRYNDAFYCSFREGTGHIPGEDGKIRVIRSKDGQRWESVALLQKDTFDLRDPSLSVTPDNRIMISIGGSIYDRQVRNKFLARHPMVSFSDAKGENFSAPGRSVIDPPGKNNWIWRVTWHKGIAYGMCYMNEGLALLKSTDGRHYERMTVLDIDGAPNESTIRFDKNDRMVIMVRREEKDQMGVLASSMPPYTNWTYKKLTRRLGGPNFLFSPDGKYLIMGTRLYEPDGHYTGILVTDLDGNIIKTIKLPSKGDTSYPGMVIHNGKLWFTYYSSHEAKTSIYATTIPLKQLLP